MLCKHGTPKIDFSFVLFLKMQVLYDVSIKDVDARVQARRDRTAAILHKRPIHESLEGGGQAKKRPWGPTLIIIGSFCFPLFYNGSTLFSQCGQIERLRPLLFLKPHASASVIFLRINWSEFISYISWVWQENYLMIDYTFWWKSSLKKDSDKNSFPVHPLYFADSP